MRHMIISTYGTIQKESQEPNVQYHMYTPSFTQFQWTMNHTRYTNKQTKRHTNKHPRRKRSTKTHKHVTQHKYQMQPRESEPHHHEPQQATNFKIVILVDTSHTSVGPFTCVESQCVCVARSMQIYFKITRLSQWFSQIKLHFKSCV